MHLCAIIRVHSKLNIRCCYTSRLTNNTIHSENSIILCQPADITTANTELAVIFPLKLNPCASLNLRIFRRKHRIQK